jgi:hypothetical protein
MLQHLPWPLGERMSRRPEIRGIFRYQAFISGIQATYFSKHKNCTDTFKRRDTNLHLLINQT